jgi:hypothetical protein
MPHAGLLRQVPRGLVVTFLGILVPTLSLAGWILVLRFQTTATILYATLWIVYSFLTATPFQLIYLYNKFGRFLSDIDVLRHNYILYVDGGSKYSKYLERVLAEDERIFTFLIARPRTRAVEELSGFRAHALSWGGSIILAPEKLFGSALQQFLFYHEIGHCLPSSTMHGLLKVKSHFRELVRYAPGLMIMSGIWPFLGLLTLCIINGFLNRSGILAEIDCDYFAARCLFLTKSRDYCRRAIGAARHAHLRHMESHGYDSQDRRLPWTNRIDAKLHTSDYRRRATALDRIQEQLLENNTARMDPFPHGPMFRTSGMNNGLMSFAAIVIICLFARVPNVTDVVVLTFVSVISSAIIDIEFMKVKNVGKDIRSTLEGTLDRTRSDPIALDGLLRSFSAENVSLKRLGHQLFFNWAWTDPGT